jgi:hypothetical protein
MSLTIRVEIFSLQRIFDASIGINSGSLGHFVRLKSSLSGWGILFPVSINYPGWSVNFIVENNGAHPDYFAVLDIDPYRTANCALCKNLFRHQNPLSL